MFDVLFFLHLIIVVCGELVEVTYLIFLTKQFLKKRSDLQQAYYYVLYISYLMNAIQSIPRFLMRTIGPVYGNYVVGVCQVIMWYYYYIPGICECMLSLNRCTGIAFPVIHAKMWHGTPLKFLIALIPCFPFIVSGYTLFNFYCRMWPFMIQTCFAYTDVYVLSVIFINISLTIIALLLIIFGTWWSQKLQARNTAIAKLERKMIIYTTISSSLLVLRYTFSLLSYYNNKHAYVLDGLGTAMYYIQHYAPLFLLPFLNIIYRQELFKFLGIRMNPANIVALVSTKTIIGD
uniref:Serpentine receptor class gamma n=1 Tax=Panagrellus redivivus TaxID=6233 RepID=A0A7E4VK93_PANRE